MPVNVATETKIESVLPASSDESTKTEVESGCDCLKKVKVNGLCITDSDSSRTDGEIYGGKKSCSLYLSTGECDPASALSEDPTYDLVWPPCHNGAEAKEFEDCAGYTAGEPGCTQTTETNVAVVGIESDVVCDVGCEGALVGRRVRSVGDVLSMPLSAACFDANTYVPYGSLPAVVTGTTDVSAGMVLMLGPGSVGKAGT